jgi:hypothetical protein
VKSLKVYVHYIIKYLAEKNLHIHTSFLLGERRERVVDVGRELEGMCCKVRMGPPILND